MISCAGVESVWSTNCIRYDDIMVALHVGINTAYLPLDHNKNLGSCLGPREAISQSDTA